MDEELLREILLLKNEKYLFKSVAKLLILLHKIYNSTNYTNLFKEYYSNMLRELFGGSYTNVIKDAVIAGYVSYERGTPPELTLDGQAVAEELVRAWEREKERKREAPDLA